MTSSKSTKSIGLALQGGGAHGAFAWGVLDRLLEDGRIDVEGLSGTSAGSMNAVVFAYGLINGRDAAREARHGRRAVARRRPDHRAGNTVAHERGRHAGRAVIGQDVGRRGGARAAEPFDAGNR